VIEKGRAWGVPVTDPADHEVHGDDTALADRVSRSPGALIRFRPSPTSDLARAVGLADVTVEHDTRNGTSPRTALPMDTIDLGNGVVAVNIVVLGTPPDRLTPLSRGHRVRVVTDGRAWFDGVVSTIVVAVGQWLRGHDVVPRGHPGDGHIEVQAYRLRRSERRPMRRRLATGSHVPHPRIVVKTARELDVFASRALPIEVDGASGPAVTRLHAEVRPEDYRLLM
jgi:YegS C-terminal NAD kinase beta sandwich-like domain